MSVTRRGFLTALSATALSLPVMSACSNSKTSTGPGSGGGGGGKADSSIKFGYISDYNGVSLLAVADKLGLWKKHGLTVDVTSFSNGPIQIQALNAGDLDFGYIGPGAMWLPASGKSRIVAINTLTYADRVIGQPGLETIKDLRGKRIGVPEGTSGEMILNLALQDAGMTMKDIKKIPMDPPTVVSAFSSGKIDGAGIFYPLVDTMKEKVPKLEEVASTRDLPDSNFPTAFVSGQKVSDATVSKVLKVLQEANDWREQNYEESIKLSAKMLKISEDKVAADAKNVKIMTTDDLVAKTKDGTVEKWLDGMSDFFVKTGQLKEKPKAADFYTADLYTKAAGK
ncbi:aliphatic sulfonate ABC transporter substrate-binding protein [Streptomyces boninensis]|uniref:aliphatic sulfonate ABC transporter substrate-binding protein n=1 Tax=Streptomyces boninensis TaxID=2039455 RepID=UPI003B21EDEE